MSNNNWLGIGLSLAVGAVAGILAPGAAFSWLYAFGGFAIASSFLIKPPIPTNTNKPTDFGNSGRVTNTRDAAAEQLKINPSTEAITVPVAFGTVRISANHIGYDDASFRTVPIIQRQERAPQVVAYRIAQETFESSPGTVNHEIDRAARKTSGAAGGKGKSGGKGGGKAPPPSKSYSDADKINYYTQVLLDNDESGKGKLPREYDEFTSGYKYYLTWRMGVCMGEITDWHAVISYPGQKPVVSRYQDSAIAADDTTETAEGPTQGGTIRLYRGSPGQSQNVADPMLKDYGNARHVCFATFENYYMGNAPAPESFEFEITRIPVCLDADGDPVADLETRAGVNTPTVAVTSAVWEGNTITVTAPGHGLAVGNTAFLADFEPKGYNGTYVVATVVGDVWTAALVTEPPVPTLFGKMQAPPEAGPGTPVDSATWADSAAKLKVVGHGLSVDQLVELTGFTPAAWNGAWRAIFLKDSDHFTIAMPYDPGAATVLGTFRRYPLPADITAANWADGKVTFESNGASDLADGDTVHVYDMEPPVYNGLYTVIEGDSGSFDVALNSPPAPATKMGTALGPSHSSPRAIGHVESWVGGVVTFDMSGSDPTGYEVGNKVLVEGCTPAGYNGTFTVTKINGDQWSAALATDPGPLTVEGTATLQDGAQTVLGASWEAGVATYQVARHGFTTGDSVIIADMLPAGYNGTFTLTDTTGDSFTVDMADDPGRVLTLGTSRLRPDAGYGDANPAAILYELLTNRIWGRGLSPNLIDIPSFVRASQYFLEEGQGMSFTLDSPGGLSDAVETIRAHVNLAVMWVGDLLYCQALGDRSTAYSPRIVITYDSVTAVEFTRDAWPAAFNEVRVGFQDRFNNFESALATVQSQAGINTLGYINSTKVDLPAVSNRDTATLIAQRMLFEMAYPQAALTFRVQRFHTRLIPSSFVEFRWNEWSDDPITMYFRVVEIDDSDQDGGGIKVMLVEDIWSTAVLGTSNDFTPPVPVFEGMVRPSIASLYLGGDKTQPADLTRLLFGFAEIPITLSDFTRQMAAFCQRTEDGKIASIAHLWREKDSGGDFGVMGVTQPWGIAARLSADLAADGPPMSRDVPFEIQLRDSRERARILEYCSTLSADSDSFETVAASQKNWLIIGNEFIQVAQAEAGAGANRVLITAYLRGGNYGSEQVAHAAGTDCFFVYEFVPYAHLLPWDSIPVDTPLEIKTIPTDRSGRTGDSYSNDFTITGLSLKALRIDNIRSEVDGDDWLITYRPRWHNRGADIYTDFYESCNALIGAIPTGYEVAVMPTTKEGGELLAEPAFVVIDFEPDDPLGMDPTKGMATFTYTPPEGAAALLVMQVYQGQLGLPARIRVVGSDAEDDGGGDEGGGGDPTILRIDVSAEDLPALSGTFDWPDRDTTDAQDNTASIDWTYTPAFGDPKPTLSGGDHLSGLVNGYPPTINFPLTPLGITPLEFEAVVDCTPGGSWIDPTPFTYNANLARVKLTDAFLQLGFELSGTGALRFYAWCDQDAAPFANGAKYFTITAGVQQTLGARLTNASAGQFDMEILVNGAVASTHTLMFDLTEVTEAKLTISGGNANTTLQLDLYTFKVSSL